MLVHPRTTLDVKTLENLSSYNSRSKEEAEQRLNQLGDKAVEALLYALEDESVARRRSRTLQILKGVGLILGLVVVLGIVAILTQGIGGDVFLGDVFGGICQDYFAPMPFSIAYRNAVIALARSDDVRALPALLHIHHKKDTSLWGDCYTGIIRMSNLVTPSHAPLFDEEAHQNLRLGLSNPDFRYACAILKIIGEVGEEKDLPIVKNLTLLPTLTEGNREVRQSATVALPRLQLNLENRTQARTLLRASSPTTPTEMLLRPAQASPIEPQNQLLRPTDSTPK